MMPLSVFSHHLLLARLFRPHHSGIHLLHKHLVSSRPLQLSTMAPKNGAGSSKRKASEDDMESDSNDNVEARNARTKKTKSSTSAKSSSKTSAKPKGTNSGEAGDGEAGGGRAANEQPTNKQLPTEISFASKAEGAVRIASWNVSGLAAARKKSFERYIEAEDADILILTETKMNDVPKVEELDSRYPHRYWSAAAKKGYAGTAVLSKHEPLNVAMDLPGHPDADAVKGRIVTLEYEQFYLIGTYVTNAGQGLKTLKEKEVWNEHFERYIRDLDAKKPVVWGGDLNVAPTEIDLSNPRPNWNKTPGYTESETKAFARILSAPSSSKSKDADAVTAGGFVDVWRHLHPSLRHYTYFGYRFNCREKGIGWRLDMFVVSRRWLDRVKTCEIRSEIYGASDHCPIIVELEAGL